MPTMGHSAIHPLLLLIAAAALAHGAALDCPWTPAATHGFCKNGGAAGDAKCSERCKEEHECDRGGECIGDRCYCRLNGDDCATAHCWGDPHCGTLDGASYHPQLAGRHVLLRPVRAAKVEPFTLWGENSCWRGDCTRPGGGVSVLGKVELEVFGKTVTFGYNYQTGPLVDGAKTALPYTHVTRNGDHFFKVNKAPRGVMIETSVGLKVVTYAYNLRVSVPKSGSYEGALGYGHDGNRANDFRTPDGTVVGAPRSRLAADNFLAAWMIDGGKGRGKPARASGKCDSPAMQRRIQALCVDKINGVAEQCMSGPYQTAFSYRLKVMRHSRHSYYQRVVNRQAPVYLRKWREEAIEGCSMDVCMLDNPHDPVENGACDAMHIFESVCASYKYKIPGLEFGEYHSEKFCPLTCSDPNAVYANCAGCERTCTERGKAKKSCEDECFGPGCVCKRGHFYHEGKQQCVRANRCK